MTSLLKKSLIAGATALTLGAGMAAVPTSADARGFGGGGFHGGGFHGGGFRGGFHGGFGGRQFGYGYGYRGGWHRGWGGYGLGTGLVLGALASDYAYYGNCSPYGYGYGPYGYGGSCFYGRPYGGYGGYYGY